MNKSIATYLLLAISAGTGTALLAQQDQNKPNKPGSAQTTNAGASATEAKWRAFATPGEAHHALDSRVGTWDVDVKMMESPNGAATTSKVTSDIKWIMDGRFLEETVQGEFMGQSFTGQGTTGYDNLKKKYVSSWIDNMSTGLMVAEGTYDTNSKTFTTTGDCPDVNAGKYVHSRSVSKVVDDDHWTVQTYKAGADGKEFLAGELDYTRKK